MSFDKNTENCVPNSEKDKEQAQFFYNRILKRNKHLKKLFKKQETNCYRIYDRDIPEIPLSLDLYKENAVMYLYERPYEKAEELEEIWLSQMADAASKALGIEKDNIFIKRRKRLSKTEQYEKTNKADTYYVHQNNERENLPKEKGKNVIVSENALSFLVKLDSYIDTGLFMDNRPARELVGAMSEGKSVLNLFCYTGSFSVYALAGNAKKVSAIDLSKTYLSWAEENIRLNNLDIKKYFSFHADVKEWLKKAKDNKELFDLIILDPPTFSNSKRMNGILDTSKEWPVLVNACLDVLNTDGTILFSSNAKSLRLDPVLLPQAHFEDISKKTIPEDYRGKPHQTWLITHGTNRNKQST